VHAIVAVDTDAEGEPAWGVVSDLDLVSIVAAGGLDGHTAGDAAATDVVLVAPDETLERATQLMLEHAVSHLIVADRKTTLPVGVLSTLDIAGVLSRVKEKHEPSAMRVEHVMTRDVVTVSPSMSLREVAGVLVEHGISGVPVTRDGEVVGIVSERDVLAKERSDLSKPDGLLGWFLGEDPDAEKHWARTAGDAMTAPAVTIEPWRSTASAAGIMAERGLKRLAVVHEGELVGIITRADLVRAFARPDAEIERDIHEQVLLRAFWLPPGAIAVEVRNGDVSLTGEVDSAAVHAALPVEIARVPGVVSVDSRVVLRQRPEPAV
jgi:CBS domain-containing protein